MLKNVNGGQMSDDDYMSLFLYILDCNEEGLDVEQAVDNFTRLWNASFGDNTSVQEDYKEAVKFIRENYNETTLLDI